MQPVYYLAKGPAADSAGGRRAGFIAALTRAAREAGVTFRHECAALALVTEDGRVSG